MRYVETVNGATPNQANPGGFLADLGINTRDPGNDITEFYKKLSAIFLAFGMDATNPQVGLSKEVSKFLQDVTGSGLPNLQRSDKDELQAIFSVLQKPSLEAMVTGRYAIDFAYKVAADQVIVKQGTAPASVRVPPLP